MEEIDNDQKRKSAEEALSGAKLSSGRARTIAGGGGPATSDLARQGLR